MAASMNSSQSDWISTKQPAREPVPPVIAEVIRKRSILDAIEYAQECAALENKQVYGPLGWSAELWSRIFNQDAKNPVFFDARRLVPFMELTNDAPLMWLAHQRGLDWSTIRPYQTDLERENFELRQKLAEKDRELAVAAQLISGRVPR